MREPARRIILVAPEWEHGTGKQVPIDGAWKNQHGEVLLLKQGDTFPPCENPAGEVARWKLIETV